MPADASQDAVTSEGTASGRPLTRRWFLTYVVAAPVLTVAAGNVGGFMAPGTAHAVVPSPPQPENITDLGEVMVAATRAAQHLLVLEVTPENQIIFRVPRAEVGQGITTALAIMVADEIDARLADVDVPLEDARQDLGTAQSTGGSSSVRSLWDPVRSVAAEARARLVTAAAERWDLPARDLSTRDTAVWAPTGAQPRTGRSPKRPPRWSYQRSPPIRSPPRSTVSSARRRPASTHGASSLGRRSTRSMSMSRALCRRSWSGRPHSKARSRRTTHQRLSACPGSSLSQNCRAGWR